MEHAKEGDIYLNGVDMHVFIDGEWRTSFLKGTIEVSSLEMKKAIRNANKLIKNSILY